MNANIAVNKVTIKGTYRVVRNDELIESTDLVRCTQSNQFSDHVNYEALTAMNWHSVKEGLPAWIGKTLQDFYTLAKCDLDYFEIIRSVPVVSDANTLPVQHAKEPT